MYFSTATRLRFKQALQSSLGQPNHPFFAFFVVALMPTSFLFDLLSYVSSNVYFSRAALYTMTVGLVSAALAIPTGLASYVDIDRRVPAKRVAATHMPTQLSGDGVVRGGPPLAAHLARGRAHPTRPTGPVGHWGRSVAALWHLGGKLVYNYGIGLRGK